MTRAATFEEWSAAKSMGIYPGTLVEHNEKKEAARIAALGASLGKTSIVSAIIEQYGVDGYLGFLASVKAEIEAEKS